jgi:hypothetical protein
MWSALIAGLRHQAHSLADAVRLLEGDKDIRIVCGFSQDKLPSQDARWGTKGASHHSGPAKGDKPRAPYYC